VHDLKRFQGSPINLESAPQMAEYRAAADRIAAAGHLEVLDWCCGYGQLSAMLRERGVRVTAMDYDPTPARQ
jgi:2-polyprenyl-3-methyl-5-hydroxy-6-metoxy-1,4-benzoquinol methylase